jgi:hypothetical protein
LLTGFGSTFEVHVTIPLNHRGVFREDDLASTADVVDLTAGANLEFRKQARLALALAVPVTGPKPYNLEVLAQFRRNF